MKVKGVCHVHSRYSYDGKHTLEELRELFTARGISFALMSEHTDHLTPESAELFLRECEALSDSDFLFIPGFEVPYLGNHVLALAASRYPSSFDASEMLKEFHAQGALLVLAHPHRNNFQTDTFLKNNLLGIEVWNSQYDGIHAPRSQAMQLFRGLGKEERYAFGSIDFHRSEHVGGPCLISEIPILRREAVVESIRDGAYVISRGPVTVNSRGEVLEGNPFLISIAGYLLPGIISALKKISSFFAIVGIKKLPLKSTIRAKL